MVTWDVRYGHMGCEVWSHEMLGMITWDVRYGHMECEVWSHGM